MNNDKFFVISLVDGIIGIRDESIEHDDEEIWTMIEPIGVNGYLPRKFKLRVKKNCYIQIHGKNTSEPGCMPPTLVIFEGLNGEKGFVKDIIDYKDKTFDEFKKRENKLILERNNLQHELNRLKDIREKKESRKHGVGLSDDFFNKKNDYGNL